MPQPPKTTPGAGFSLDAVATILRKAGALNDDQVWEVLRSGKGKEASLRRQFKTKDGDEPYVSPIEVIASFGFPSSNPRRKTMDTMEISEAYAANSSLPFIQIDPLKIDAKALCRIVSKPFARKHLLVPVKLEGGRLTVAMVNPFDREVVHGLEDVTGYTIEPALGIRGEILKTINEIFALEQTLLKAEEQRDAIEDLANLEQLVDLVSDREVEATDRHVVNAVDMLFQYAYQQRASDIHIEPKRDKALVRVRIDGRLHTTHSIPKKVYPAIVSRVKILARMDIAEKRRPQDGRIKTKFRTDEIELRISSVPMAFGEKLVIRIFDPGLLLQDLGALGLFEEQLKVFKRCLSRPYGIILLTGPTGSGKTTTLYSALRHLSGPEVNITTIEDPIEMVHEPFNQIAVNTQTGLTFSSALRNVLRQDPDIVMVGEIRDKETAEYAVQAALTGHLVLSTLHTNTAAGAVTRLRDLGIEYFLLASTLVAVVAQRLVRKICTECDGPGEATAEERRHIGVDGPQVDLSGLRAGRGCEKCRKTGYRGRTALVEIIEMTDAIRSLVRRGADELEIQTLSRKSGSSSLMHSAARNLLLGRTTAEEILRVVPPDNLTTQD